MRSRIFLRVHNDGSNQRRRGDRYNRQQETRVAEHIKMRTPKYFGSIPPSQGTSAVNQPSWRARPAIRRSRLMAGAGTHT